MVDVVLAGTKAEHRAALLAARRAVAPAVREAEAAALCEHLAAVAGPGDTVCAYVPVGAEPGSVDLVDRLRDLGARVLLPVTRPGDPDALLWGEYQPGALVAGRFGLLEPAGTSLAATAIAEARVVLVPALAVDRRGVRLGRGGGYYDRSLPLRRPDALVVAVVRDEELVAELPHERHDVRMTHALTPQRGLVTLDRS
ncbi:5-formyltetrahydrofolate cyclo-ligase [Mycobacterium sp. M26]|uniref:5-formyltetrahydrofolate cyclo-ligase n=1 Tax=Mycobacterium sp. M26 TaxID=1762962 RepID=UPI000AB58955|nr:5-formyltetrahydrofolate cyclo-ligase [Mycobacterium sp. M26]